MKKFTLLALLFLAFSHLQAQTEQGRILAGIGSNISFSSTSFQGEDENTNTFGLSLRGGYFVIDDLVGGLTISYFNSSHGDFSTNTFNVGPFARYYVEQFFLGAGIVFSEGSTESDFGDTDRSGNQFNIELGYAAFINDHISVEPRLDYSIGGGDFDGNDVFTVGVGFAIYLP